MSSIANYIRLFRPHQYVKNLFILAPLFFSGKFGVSGALLPTLTAFCAFCLLASAVYVLNDTMDAEDDRKHPRKKDRPIASGAISPRSALSAMALLIFGGLGIGLSVNVNVLYCLLLYFALNIAYSLKLKHVAVLDVTIIATGFVIRLFVGMYAANVTLSHWIVVVTFLLAMFLGLAKRRDDIRLSEDSGELMRKSIDGYSLTFVNIALGVMAAAVLVAYLMYVTSAEVIAQWGTDKLYYSAIFVVVGVLRYFQIIFVQERGGSPSRVVLSDLFLIVTVLGWIGFFVWIQYVGF